MGITSVFNHVYRKVTLATGSFPALRKECSEILIWQQKILIWQALNYYRFETILHLVWPRSSSLLTARLAWITNCHQHAYRHILNTFLTGCIHKKYCIIQLGVVEIRLIESGTCAASGSPAQAWTDPRRQGTALAALPLGHFSAPWLHQSLLEG